MDAMNKDVETLERSISEFMGQIQIKRKWGGFDRRDTFLKMDRLRQHSIRMTRERLNENAEKQLQYESSIAEERESGEILEEENRKLSDRLREAERASFVFTIETMGVHATPTMTVANPYPIVPELQRPQISPSSMEPQAEPQSDLFQNYFGVGTAQPAATFSHDFEPAQVQDPPSTADSEPAPVSEREQVARTTIAPWPYSLVSKPAYTPPPMPEPQNPSFQIPIAMRNIQPTAPTVSDNKIVYMTKKTPEETIPQMENVALYAYERFMEDARKREKSKQLDIREAEIREEIASAEQRLQELYEMLAGVQEEKSVLALAKG